MVVTTDKEVLTKPFNFIVKKAKDAGISKISKDGNSGAADSDKDAAAAKADHGNERGEWSSQWDFAMSCIAYAVGLGNVWRFPYLCFSNGGGAFLIPYFFSMFICGIPLFFLEVSVGQYLGVGGMSVIGQLCPIFKGVGYSAIMMVFLENVYYIIVVAWTLYYLFNVFVDMPSLPWSDCHKGEDAWANDHCWNPDGHVPFNESKAFLSGIHKNETQSSVEQFWNNQALGISEGIGHVGGVQPHLLIALVVAWAVVYLVVWKGLHNSGKVLWFSAIFPYVILSILCVKAVTLDGAADGLYFLFTPQWDRLMESKVWIDGGTQIFFSYGVGIGALLALGSYNKFHHNCHRDAIVVCCVNTFTSFFSATVIFSILGFMAKQKGVEVKDVVESGPGLAFLVYPEVVLQIAPSPLWAFLFFIMLLTLGIDSQFCGVESLMTGRRHFLFFIMLLTLGIDSQFCGVESLMTGLVDNWPHILQPHRKKFTLGMIIFMMLLGIPMITNGGVYLFYLMDFYAASGMSLLWCVFFQTIAISWVFGAKKFYLCIEHMIGYKVNWYWYICWVLLAPAFMLFIFVFYFIKYKPITYGEHYAYPPWGEAIGFMISLSSMLWVPGYFIYYMLTTPGTWREVLAKGVTPLINARPEAIQAELKYREAHMEAVAATAEVHDVEMLLVQPDQVQNCQGSEEAQQS